MIGFEIEVLYGEVGLIEVFEYLQCYMVMVVIVGVVGFLFILVVVKFGKCVLLVNKEVLVMSGQIFMVEVVGSGVELLLIDSEYNVIY